MKSTNKAQNCAKFRSQRRQCGVFYFDTGKLGHAAGSFGVDGHGCLQLNTVLMRCACVYRCRVRAARCCAALALFREKIAQQRFALGSGNAVIHFGPVMALWVTEYLGTLGDAA